LIELKKTKYGPFILNDLEVLRLMKRENSKSVTDNCVFLTKGIALNPKGEKKQKCMMGDKADCDRCGCIVPYHLAWISEKKKIMGDLFADLSVYFSSRARALFSKR